MSMKLKVLPADTTFTNWKYNLEYWACVELSGELHEEVFVLSRVRYPNTMGVVTLHHLNAMSAICINFSGIDTKYVTSIKPTNLVKKQVIRDHQLLLSLFPFASVGLREEKISIWHFINVFSSMVLSPQHHELNKCLFHDKKVWVYNMLDINTPQRKITLDIFRVQPEFVGYCAIWPPW